MSATVDGDADEYQVFRSGAGTNHIIDPESWSSLCGHIEPADLGDDPKESDDPTPSSLRTLSRFDVPNFVDCKSCRTAQAKAEYDALGVDVADLDEGDVVRYWAGRPYWEAGPGATSHRTTGVVDKLPPYERRIGGGETKTETERVQVVDKHSGLTFRSDVRPDRILEVVDE